MSLLVGGVQANQTTYYSPITASATTLISDASGIPTGITNVCDPSGTPAGLYSVIVHSSSNGYNISDTIYSNGINFSAGGNVQNIAGNLQIYTAQPYKQISINNTSGGIIPGGVQLIPLSIGKIQGMP